jgi:hypothetical protein
VKYVQANPVIEPYASELWKAWGAQKSADVVRWLADHANQTLELKTIAAVASGVSENRDSDQINAMLQAFSTWPDSLHKEKAIETVLSKAIFHGAPAKDLVGAVKELNPSPQKDWLVLDLAQKLRQQNAAPQDWVAWFTDQGASSPAESARNLLNRPLDN